MRKTMNTASEVKVTLTRALFEHLSVTAREIGVPLEWLVASLVVEMLEAGTLQPGLAA
jgi:hypothetical protein